MNKPREFWIAQGSHVDIVCQNEQHAKDLGWSKSYIHTIEKSAYDYYKDHAEMLKAELDKANKKLSWYESGNIHTCNYQCERPLCVQRRKIDELEKEKEEFYHEYRKSFDSETKKLREEILKLKNLENK